MSAHASHLHSHLQAIVLCGPGSSLSTLTSVPSVHPKALVSLANRPLVWYVLEWCYRMGVSDITLVTPPESQAALSSALAQNPHLTSLPSPSPTLIAPADLSHDTGTAELLRLPEVQSLITRDFLLLPCDLICAPEGSHFLEAWMATQGGLGGATDGLDNEHGRRAWGGERGGRRGGLSVWYSTAGREESVKNEETDFCATSDLPRPHAVPGSRKVDGKGDRAVVRELVSTMPMSSLRDECEESRDQAWHVRASLLAGNGAVKCLTKFRDAHIYLFPYWVKDFARLNEDFESVGEDLVGTWAKMGWRKPAYRVKFHAAEIFGQKLDKPEPEGIPIEEEIDIMSLSSTQTTRPPTHPKSPSTFASRVTNGDGKTLSDANDPPTFPPILSYIHAPNPSSPIIRRIDSSALLLSVSLLIAKLPATDEAGQGHPPSPFSHASKVASSAAIAPRTSISRADVLVGENATVAEKCVIKESVIGPAAVIGAGSRLTRCVVMDGATVGERCTLMDCVVGKKANVGKGSSLQRCEVQDENVIGEGTDGKDEKYLVGGLEDEIEEEASDQ